MLVINNAKLYFYPLKNTGSAKDIPYSPPQLTYGQEFLEADGSIIGVVH